MIVNANGKEKGNGPFPGDDILYSFKLYSDPKLDKPAGSAMFTCYYTFAKRATCDSYFELDGGVLLASGQVVFDGTRFTAQRHRRYGHLPRRAGRGERDAGREERRTPRCCNCWGPTTMKPPRRRVARRAASSRAVRPGASDLGALADDLRRRDEGRSTRTTPTIAPAASSTTPSTPTRRSRHGEDGKGGPRRRQRPHQLQALQRLRRFKKQIGSGTSTPARSPSATRSRSARPTSS